MICCKEINEYIDYYENNKKYFNRERILLMENIVKPTLKQDDVFFDEDTFYTCIKYVEKNFYPLFPYQKFIYAFVFMYDKEDFPLFRTFFIMMGRGNGKDGFIAPLLSFFQTEYYGIPNYNIDIVATSEQQAKDTFDEIYNVLDSNKSKYKKSFKWNKEEIIGRKTKAKLKYNTSNGDTKDGKKDGCIVFNEKHAYKSNDLINVFTSGAGKVRHFRIFIITTNGKIREGPLDEDLDLCEMVLAGDNDIRYFPFICKIDAEEEVDNEEMWIKANPSYPYMPALRHEMKMQYKEMKKKPSSSAEFMTKRMNWPKRSQDEQVTDWENILKASYSDVKKKIVRQMPNLKDNQAIIGIDLATVNDFATAGILLKNGNEYIWRCKTWICTANENYEHINFPFDRKGQEGFNDFEIVNDISLDFDEIVNWCMSQMEMYNVIKIIMDMYRFKLLKKAFADKGFDDTYIETKQNPNGLIRMIKYIPSVEAIYIPFIEMLFLKCNLNIGNSAIMRWAINNTCVKQKKDGNRSYEKIEPKLRKNDPFMAFFCAYSGHELFDKGVIYV